MRAQDSVKAESGKDFLLSEKYGFLHSCPTNLGTGTMQAYLFLIHNFFCYINEKYRDPVPDPGLTITLKVGQTSPFLNFRFCL